MKGEVCNIGAEQWNGEQVVFDIFLRSELYITWVTKENEGLRVYLRLFIYIQINGKGGVC